jgi:hypothetical protein
MHPELNSGLSGDSMYRELSVPEGASALGAAEIGTIGSVNWDAIGGLSGAGIDGVGGISGAGAGIDGVGGVGGVGVGSIDGMHIGNIDFTTASLGFEAGAVGANGFDLGTAASGIDGGIISGGTAGFDGSVDSSTLTSVTTGADGTVYAADGSIISTSNTFEAGGGYYGADGGYYAGSYDGNNAYNIDGGVVGQDAVNYSYDAGYSNDSTNSSSDYTYSSDSVDTSSSVNSNYSDSYDNSFAAASYVNYDNSASMSSDAYNASMPTPQVDEYSAAAAASYSVANVDAEVAASTASVQTAAEYMAMQAAETQAQQSQQLYAEASQTAQHEHTAQAEAQHQAQMHAMMEQQAAQLREQQSAMTLQAQERVAQANIQHAAHQATTQQFYGGAPGSNRMGPGQRDGSGRSGGFGSKQWARTPGAPPSSVKDGNGPGSRDSGKQPQKDWTTGLAIGNIKRRSRTIKKQSREEQDRDLAALQEMQNRNEA